MILGIDPGFRVTGYGLLNKGGRGAVLIDAGALVMSPKLSLAQRIAIFHDFFGEKIRANAVTLLALETPFLGKNAQNFLKLGYLRGMLYFLSERHHLALAEFSPSQVKRAVTGSGAADKEQVARALRMILPHFVPRGPHDITDAIAVALCGLWQRNQV